MISLVTQLYVVEHDLEIAYTLSKYLIFPLKKKIRANETVSAHTELTWRDSLCVC